MPSQPSRTQKSEQHLGSQALRTQKAEQHLGSQALRTQKSEQHLESQALLTQKSEQHLESQALRTQNSEQHLGSQALRTQKSELFYGAKASHNVGKFCRILERFPRIFGQICKNHRTIRPDCPPRREKETANLRSSSLILREKAPRISGDKRRLAVSKLGSRVIRRFPKARLAVSRIAAVRCMGLALSICATRCGRDSPSLPRKRQAATATPDWWKTRRSMSRHPPLRGCVR